MTEEEYLKLEEDLKQNPLPPLPQRSSRRTNKQGAPSVGPPPEDIEENDNMDTATITTNFNTTTTTTNTTSTTVTPTNTTTYTPLTTSLYANVLTNMSSYKNNLIQKLLGQQGRVANTTQDNPNP